MIELFSTIMSLNPFFFLFFLLVLKSVSCLDKQRSLTVKVTCMLKYWF